MGRAWRREQRKRKVALCALVVIGAMFLVPSIYFLFAAQESDGRFEVSTHEGAEDEESPKGFSPVVTVDEGECVKVSVDQFFTLVCPVKEATLPPAGEDRKALASVIGDLIKLHQGDIPPHIEVNIVPSASSSLVSVYLFDEFDEHYAVGDGDTVAHAMDDLFIKQFVAMLHPSNEAEDVPDVHADSGMNAAISALHSPKKHDL